jgi:two-component system cell cycle sensor histidine kinase/response regulator CckA
MIRVLPSILATLVALIALLVLLGWTTGSPTLKSLGPGLETMKPNTAVAFLLAATSLFLVPRRERTARLFGYICAGSASLIGLLTLGEHVFGWNPGIDELLFKDDSPAARLPPGRMAGVTATNFALIGIGLGCLHYRAGFRITLAFLIPVACLSFVSFAGHVYGVRALYASGPFAFVAVHSALSFLLLSGGMLLAEPSRGVIAMLRLPGLSGVLARRLLPVAFTVPLVLGWLGLLGYRARLYRAEFGLALLILCITLVLVVLVWRTLTLLSRLEAESSKAALALKRNYSLLSAVIDGTNDAVFIKDLAGRYVLANRVTAEVLQLSPDDIVGKDDMSLFPPETARSLMQTDQTIMRTGEPQLVEEVVTGPGGEQQIFLSTKSPWRNEHGEIIGLIGISNDITGRKRLEEKFLQAQKMDALGRLAGGVAHDFNNLLTIIIGAGEMLRQEMLLRRFDMHDYLDEIMKAADRGAGLTNQLLAFSRQQIVQPKIIDINNVVRNFERMLRRVIGEHIEQRTRLSSAPMLVRADPGQLEQVLLNLAVNARDAMPTGGTLLIETTQLELSEPFAGARSSFRPGTYAMLAVSDTGIGMDEEVRRHLFEPFFTTKERGKGTGLGLSTVFGIITQSGGDISVYSEVGRGTTFKIYLPSVAADSAAVDEVPASKPLPPAKGIETILLVEDNEAVRKLTIAVLRRLGYIVVEAADAQEAQQLFSQHRVDLIVSDIVMPKTSGVQLVEQLRRVRPELPVLYMSGYTDDALDMQELTANYAILQKPFTPENLARHVRTALDASSAQ